MDTIKDMESLTSQQLFTQAIEENFMQEVTKFSKESDVTCRVFFTTHLMNELFPYAEDAVKGIEFEHRVLEVMQRFKEASKLALNDFITLTYTYQSYATGVEYIDAEKDSDKVRVGTRKDGSTVDKKVNIFASGLNDEKGEPTLILGIAVRD